MISGQRIFLRPAVSADAPTVMRWENDPELWPVSETPGPFSLNDIQGFISESSDLFTQGQLRLIICLKKDAMAVGAVDIFNFNSLQKMAGIGIVLGEKEFRNKGIASEAIRILQEFVERDLGMRQLE